MKLGVVMPVWMQEQAVLEMTRRAVGCLNAWDAETTLYVVPTRLGMGLTPKTLRDDLGPSCLVPVEILHDGRERSVAGAWNLGIGTALERGSDFAAVVANDALLDSGCLHELTAFGLANPSVDVWSGIDTRQDPRSDRHFVTEGCDFTCAMLRPETVRRHGLFDAHYRPAYYEDNDYFVRVCLGGGACRVVHAARFYHHGSMTTRLDPEAAHHVRHWFGINRARFAAKWGTPDPPHSAADALARCHHRPWGDPALPLTFWDRP